MATRPTVPKSVQRIFEVHLRQLARLNATHGQRGLRRLYQSALRDLAVQMARAPKGGSTAIQLRTMIAQVEAALSLLGKRLDRHLSDVSLAAANLGASHGVAEFKLLSEQLAGTTPILSLDRASVFKGMVKGVHRSLLRRHHRLGQVWMLNAIDAIERTLSTGMLAGRPLEDQINAVVGAGGIGDQMRWKAERIVRTEIAHAHGATKFDSMGRIEKDLGRPLWKKLIETFDDRTGDDSFLQHGQTVPIGTPFTWKKRVRGRWVLEPYMHPPNRPNDRAVVISWDPEWGEGMESFEKALTRSELQSARPTRWRKKPGVKIPPGHRPGRSYRGKVTMPPPPTEP